MKREMALLPGGSTRVFQGKFCFLDLAIQLDCLDVARVLYQAGGRYFDSVIDDMLDDSINSGKRSPYRDAEREGGADLLALAIKQCDLVTVATLALDEGITVDGEHFFCVPQPLLLLTIGLSWGAENPVLAGTYGDVEMCAFLLACGARTATEGGTMHHAALGRLGCDDAGDGGTADGYDDGDAGALIRFLFAHAEDYNGAKWPSHLGAQPEYEEWSGLDHAAVLPSYCVRAMLRSGLFTMSASAKEICGRSEVRERPPCMRAPR